MTIKGLILLVLYIAFLVGCAYLGKHYVRPFFDELRYKHDKELVQADYYANRYYNDLYGQCAQEDLDRQRREAERQMYARK